MHAQRYDHEADDDALDAARRIDASRGADNDNDAPPPSFDGDDPSPTVAGDIVPRGPSRRAWIIAAVAAATLSLTAFAWTRPHPAQTASAPVVTPVDIAAMATPVLQEAPERTALLVIPDESTRRGHEHGAHARSAETPRDTARQDREASATEAPASEPREDRHARSEASAASEASEAVEAAAPRPVATRDAPTRASPTSEPPAQETAGEEETETALPTDSADEVVERAVSEHSEAIERCIEAADDDAEGRVTVHLVIGRDGAVRSATPHGPDPLRAVGACLAREIRGWRLVVPDATGDTTISWPFEVESNAN